MSAPRWTVLPQRRVICITGKDAPGFLQGIVTADIAALPAQHACLSLLLNAQGKFLADFFILRTGDGYLLDTDARFHDTLLQKLTLYRLRAAVDIVPQPDRRVFAGWGGSVAEEFGLREQAGFAGFWQDCPVFVDPRLAALGVRIIADAAWAGVVAEQAGAPPDNVAGYETLCLSHGIPGSADAIPEKTLALENGYDFFGAISFTKGCYIGQEVTARSKHRGRLRKYLCPVAGESALPPPGTPILAAEIEIGEMRSACGHLGMALVHVERLEQIRAEGNPILTNNILLDIEIPKWAIQK